MALRISLAIQTREEFPIHHNDESLTNATPSFLNRDALASLALLRVTVVSNMKLREHPHKLHLGLRSIMYQRRDGSSHSRKLQIQKALVEYKLETQIPHENPLGAILCS